MTSPADLREAPDFFCTNLVPYLQPVSILSIVKEFNMKKNFANNFYYEAEANAEAYFACSVRC